MKYEQLQSLYVLKLVATKKSFTAAAKDLGISPSAVSQSIKQLEQRLGVALLSRTTRSTSLTEIGEKFLAETGQSLDKILLAMDNVKTHAQKPSGLLRLNMPKVMYNSYLENIIESFVKKYPDISIELFFEDKQVDVIASGFDAGIRYSDILAKDMVALKLTGPIKFVTAASPKYFKKMGIPKHPKDLLAHNCIRVRFGDGNLYDRWEFNHRGKEFQIHVDGTYIFNDPLLAIETAINGGGMIYMIEDVIREYRHKKGRLDIVLKDYACSSAGFYLYYPTRTQVQPKLRVFIDHIKEQNRKRDQR